MPASERVKEEEGGEPKKPLASTPPHLGDLYRSLEPEINAGLKTAAGPAALFAESLSYELNRSLRGAAQLIGEEGRVSEQAEPQQATDFLGKNAQMLGRAAGGLLPMLGIAAGTRYGFGKVLAHDVQVAEHALLRRTTVGLSAAESGATGLLYGSLLTPTEGAAKDDLGSFACERARSGASSGLAFALMSAGSIGLSKLASTEFGAAIGAEKLMRIGAVNGIISGIPGGIANVEADSLVRTGKLDFDKEHLGRSMYEMALFGGTFGLGSDMLARGRTTGSGRGASGANTWKDLTEASLSVTPKQHLVLTDDYRRAANDNYRPAANDNFQLSDHALEWKMAVGDDHAILPDTAPLLQKQSAPGFLSAIAGRSESAKVASAEAADGLKLIGIMSKELAGSMSAISESAHNTNYDTGYSKQFADEGVLQGEASSARAPAARAPSDEISAALLAENAGKILSREWTRESLVEAISAGRRNLQRADLRGLDLMGVNFAGVDLGSADFSGSNLRGADFSSARFSFEFAKFDGADLAGVNFSGKFLRRASFKGATNLAQTNFEGAKLGAADFSGTDLKNVDFRKVAELSFANFEGADLEGANLSEKDFTRASFENANLTKAILEKASFPVVEFSGSNLTGANFSNAKGFRDASFDAADLSSVNFIGANLANVTFRGAKSFSQVIFDEASLSQADFADCDLTGVDFSKASGLSHARFYRANLDNVSFTGQSLQGAEFANAKNLNRANFSEAKLESADFSNTDLRDVDFSKAADLTHARFGYADLAGADFSGLNLSGALFEQAKSAAAAKFEGADIRSASFRWTDLVLSHYYSADSEVMQRMGQFSHYGSTEIAKFICVNPAVHKAIFEREVARGISSDKLSEQRLLSLAGLESYYGEESPIMRALTALEPDEKFLPGLERFIKESPESRSAFVAEKVLSGATAKDLAPVRLAVLMKLTTYFSSNPNDLQQLLELERKGAVVLGQVSDFIQENPEAHKQIVLQELENNAAGAEIAGEFDYGRLKALSTLSTWFGKNMELMQPILKLEKEGLSLSEVAGLLNEDPVKQAHVQTLIAQGAAVEQVQKAMREDANSLAHYLDPADSEYLDQLVGRGLRTGQLRAFIADNPVARLEQVEALIRNRVTVQRLHDQMKLSMLPDDVASRLLDNNMVAVPQIIGPMRNWQSGAYFRELLIEQVRAGETISQLNIETLSLKAQEMARAMAQEKDGGTKPSKEPGHQVETEESPSRDVVNENGAASPAKRATFPITNPRAIESANIIEEALEQILKEIPEDKTIVVLGRDALPLYPALRNQGRKVQYFLWSRLQAQDQATRKQWLKEVGPGAVVIDTGYAGSVPDAIRKIDPTASAYLLSSASQYPQLLQRHDHHSIVNNLEYFPKLVARSRTYTDKGGAVSRQGNTDEHDDGEIIKNRWTVESLNRQFLRAIGLNEWGVWRYSQYAGLTPQERLGLNTREEVDQHYRRVSELRAASAGTASP